MILQKLILSDNDLSGTIPTNIGDPFFMNTLLLEGNDLTGIMPDSVCQKPFPLEIAGVDCEEVVVSAICIFISVFICKVMRGWILIFSDHLPDC